MKTVQFEGGPGNSIGFQFLRRSDLDKLDKRKLDHDPFAPHRVQFHVIIHVRSGRGRHLIDMVSALYAPGSLLFIAKGQVHQWTPRNGMEADVLLFTEEFLDHGRTPGMTLGDRRLYDHQLYPPGLSAADLSGEDVEGLLDLIRREYAHREKQGSHEVLRNLLNVLLVKAERVKQRTVEDRTTFRHFAEFLRFRRLVEQHYRSERDALSYASWMHTTGKRLNEVVRSVSGRTAKTFIDERVLLEMKRLLAVGELSAKEVAFAMGFEEPTNMVKFFKRLTGITPGEFQARQRSR